MFLVHSLLYLQLWHSSRGELRLDQCCIAYQEVEIAQNRMIVVFIPPTQRNMLENQRYDIY
jgi:hypothetical protein